MTIINTILEIIFPSRCISCQNTGSDLCIDCLSSCPVAERECANWIYPIYEYRYPIIKKSVWMLKYKNKKRISKVFAEVLYGKIMEELADLALFENFKDPILIPIPLSKSRLHERGFNQSSLICKNIIKIDTEKPARNAFSIADAGGTISLKENILIKIKDQEHQARISGRNKRLQNIIGSFVVKNENEIKGKNIILIDDVITTGATLTEARKVLKNSGAKKIIAFTIAH